MKPLLTFLLLIIINVNTAWAEAWILKRGEVATSNGIYLYADGAKSQSDYSFLQANNSRVNLQETAKTIKYSQVNEINYGINDKATLVAKADISKIRNNLAFNVEYSGDFNHVEMTESLETINGQLGIRSLIAKDDYRSMSFALSYITGELPITHRNSLVAFEPQSIEGRLSYGAAFQKNMPFSARHSKLYHYFEWQAASRYFFERGLFEYDFSWQLGLRPNNKCLLVFGFFNRLNVYTSNKKHLNTQALMDKFNLQSLPNIQPEQMKSMLDQVFRKESIYNIHQLQAKLSYKVGDNKSLNIENIYSLYSQKSQRGNLIKVSFNVGL